MHNSYWIPPIFGPLGLLVSCCIALFGIAIALFVLYVYVGCLFDAFRKTDEEFRDRTLWIILLLVSPFVGLVWLAALVYYFMYRPRLDFWRN